MLEMFLAGFLASIPYGWAVYKQLCWGYMYIINKKDGALFAFQSEPRANVSVCVWPWKRRDDMFGSRQSCTRNEKNTWCRRSAVRTLNVNAKLPTVRPSPWSLPNRRYIYVHMLPVLLCTYSGCLIIHYIYYYQRQYMGRIMMNGGQHNEWAASAPTAKHHRHHHHHYMSWIVKNTFHT